MAVIVDACGRSCPEPVLLTKKALASKGDHYEVLVDNVTAKENVTRFAKNAGYTVSVSQEEDVYRLSLTK
ncbi:sulfurtransferase TusA family protein [Merdimmobilis hominis]|jgi:tRNA 2-thiouridine synthesizing protein A|uniref:sulfurtransferase TusA family protein n=1 Tax=Merdimmobilis hominis TaxID=2897707 RepID=UPI0006C7E37A|nr:sulfurtransferase TusA family protein [Merdimmobilis hominis]PWL60618.1 MAG: preprotein translocase subunit TatB [Oscillospiraceae bacterium]PWL62385.1 MAG: preprotein translocase subunit TatB [Oscillospiraceae bacterium]